VAVKQLVIRAGTPLVIEVPAPGPQPGRVLVANLASVISSGTERAAVASSGGGGPLPVRAVRNPELIRKGIEHLREHGLRETLDLARGFTAADLPLGYSSAGLVLDTGGIAEFRVGQLVACAGAGSANHAEVVSVAGNLVAAAPEDLDPRFAAFTTIGAIALQGVRRAAPALGDRAVVIGLGLLGLLTVQLLRASGCEVLGVEPGERRRLLAGQLGVVAAVEPAAARDAAMSWTGGAGADLVVICASGQGSGIVNDAVAMVRRKGRVVAVGDVGLDLERPALYEREADLLISTSYGPGRYDPTYEEGGVDYPIAYVRWTENRNMGEVLRLLGTRQLEVASLIEFELPVSRATEAYAALGGPEPPLAALLTYEPVERSLPEVVRTSRLPIPPPNLGKTVRVGIIGAGSFVTAVHIPNLKADPDVRVVIVANRRGTSASDTARLAGGADSATDWRAVIERDDVDLVLIGTRHDSHAEIAAAALDAGKAVFVEKPLGLTRAEIDTVWKASRTNERFAIGFNRPLAQLAQVLEHELRAGISAPVHVVYRVSAPLAPEHWLNDPAVGGGRLLGEACHMFDFANWLGGTPERVSAAALPSNDRVRTVESSTVTIEYANGSLATVHYSAVGSVSMPKERVEVMSGGRSWVLDDFRVLTSFSDSSARKEVSGRGTDKGHAELMRRLLRACRAEGPFEPGISAAYAAQAVALSTLESIATGEAVKLILPTE
jgi:predicted dehydrogenase/threonine dehydrogenase-like Zn-dependent dehydrogenase